MAMFQWIAGEGKQKCLGVYAQGVASAVQAAKNCGYRIGCRVWMGRIEGVVIGYNISRIGRYAGTGYPVIVQTELGVAKCSADELRLAA